MRSSYSLQARRSYCPRTVFSADSGSGRQFPWIWRLPELTHEHRPRVFPGQYSVKQFALAFGMVPGIGEDSPGLVDWKKYGAARVNSYHVACTHYAAVHWHVGTGRREPQAALGPGRIRTARVRRVLHRREFRDVPYRAVD